MKMNLYNVKILHDRGTFSVLVTAKNKSSAVRQLLKAETCPLRAIKSVRRIKGKSWQNY